MIECSVDVREHKMIDLLSLGSNNFEVKMLDLGDVLLHDEKYYLLMERKTWSDLHSSIIDSRFREQRSRLQQWKTENQKFIYIIEGKYKEEYKMEKRTLERLMIAYSIPVFYTNSLEETVHIIKDWMSMDNLEKLFSRRSVEEDQIEARMYSVLKKNYSDSNLFFMGTLYSLKGITTSMADSIGKEFLTIYNFMNCFHEDKEKWIKTMNSLTYKTPKNNEKRFNKKIIEKIQENFGSL
jgi:ERCC4-type nuclease